MARFKLEVITPLGVALSEEVDHVSVPGAVGRFGVYSGHRPGLSMLGGGQVTYQMGSDSGDLYIRGGVAEIRPDGVTILSDDAHHTEDLDHDYATRLRAEVSAEFAKGEFLDEGRALRLAGDRAYAEDVLKRLAP
jgi:F-type H+-transporting ATPase subunit epsilon